MRNIIIPALLLLATTPAFTEAATLPANAEYSISLTGDIEIAPDGSVHAYTLDDGLKPAVRDLVAASIEGWKFEPILVDGRPVIAKTRLRLRLKAAPVAQGLAMKVDNVWFGEPTRSSLLHPPRFPTEPARAGVDARVILVLRIDAAGNVRDAHAEQTSLSIKAGKLADRWRRQFEKASMASAMQWKFEVPEIIDGAPAESSSIRVPVDFMMGDIRGRWHGIIPGPLTPAPWLHAVQPVASAGEGLEDGAMQPLDSRFKLRTELIGSML